MINLIHGKGLAVIIYSCLIVLMLPAGLYADDADVLPKGVSRFSLNAEFFLPITEEYNDDGDKEDVAVDYNNDLNGGIFTDLRLLEAAFGMPTGSASLGTSIVDFEYQVQRFHLSYEYGLTEKLSVGIIVPYWFAKNKVDARVDTTFATIGKNVVYGTPADPTGGAAPLVPIAVGGVPLSTDDVQSLLGDGLDVNGDGVTDTLGFGYDPIKTWSDNGIGDIRVGLRYQYYQNDKWLLAFTSGIEIPSGLSDDPNSLVDYGWSNDAYGLLFHLNNDYIPTEKLRLNSTLRYHLALPDSETVRVLAAVDQPLSPIIENVDRDLGDVAELELTGEYFFTENFSATLLYKYGYKWEDDVDGDMGFDYSALEDETDYEEHVYLVGATYSTIESYQQEKFPVPLSVSLFYRDRFAGRNLFASDYIGFRLRFYF